MRPGAGTEEDEHEKLCGGSSGPGLMQSGAISKESDHAILKIEDKLSVQVKLLRKSKNPR